VAILLAVSLGQVCVILTGGIVLLHRAGADHHCMEANKARTLNNGLTVVGIDVYARQVFLGILIIIAVAVTFDRKKVTIIK
jgi:ribose/xylose/arabinose/galactoside ABC-type transport system permease subunit